MRDFLPKRPAATVLWSATCSSRSEDDTATIQDVIRGKLKQSGSAILVEEIDRVNSHVLGKNGRADEPHFWQIALEADAIDGLPARLFELVMDIESCCRSSGFPQQSHGGLQGDGCSQSADSILP